MSTERAPIDLRAAGLALVFVAQLTQPRPLMFERIPEALTRTVLLLATFTIGGCSKKDAPAPSVQATATPPSPVPSSSAGIVPSATPTPTQPVSGSVNVVNSKPGGTVELDVWDPTEPSPRVASCGAGEIVVVLPLYPTAPAWEVAVDKPLGTPKEDVRKGWLGPNTNAVAYRWDASKAKPGAYALTFTSGSDVTKVDLTIDPAIRPCR